MWMKCFSINFLPLAVAISASETHTCIGMSFMSSVCCPQSVPLSSLRTSVIQLIKEEVFSLNSVDSIGFPYQFST